MKNKVRLVLGIILLSLFALTLSIQLVAAASEWSQTYGGVGDDEAYSAVQTSDGGYALAGFTSSYGAGEYDGWLVKTDSSGNTVISRSSLFPISLQTIGIIIGLAIIIILIVVLALRRGRSRSSANPSAQRPPI